MYYRDCAINDCDRSAHWERICIRCKKHICSGHITYFSRKCVRCLDEEVLEERKTKQNKYNETYRKKKEKEEALKELKKEKLSECNEKSQFDEYYERSFFKKLNKHRIRRKSDAEE
jgi:hypothetical protein